MKCRWSTKKEKEFYYSCNNLNAKSMKCYPRCPYTKNQQHKCPNFEEPLKEEMFIQGKRYISEDKVDEKLKEKDKKNEQLKQLFEDVIWMAIRYAHGRHTYAPYMVRSTIKKFQEIYPNWKPKQDDTLQSPEENIQEENSIFQEDYLNDLFK